MPKIRKLRKLRKGYSFTNRRGKKVKVPPHYQTYNTKQYKTYSKKRKPINYNVTDRQEDLGNELAMIKGARGTKESLDDLYQEDATNVIRSLMQKGLLKSTKEKKTIYKLTPQGRTFFGYDPKDFE